MLILEIEESVHTESAVLKACVEAGEIGHG